MREIIINIEKEYHVRWYTNYSLRLRTDVVRWYTNYSPRLRTDVFETLEEAELKYQELLNAPNISHVELLECKPIKAHHE